MPGTSARGLGSRDLDTARRMGWMPSVVAVENGWVPNLEHVRLSGSTGSNGLFSCHSEAPILDRFINKST